MSTAVRTSGVALLCAYFQIESLSEDQLSGMSYVMVFCQFQVCRQTMNTVGASASSVGVHTYICVYTYIIIYI